MERILILNGSPRAPRSNSKRYAGLFAKYSPRETLYAEIRRTNHAALRDQMADCPDVVLAFPLYADSLPVPLLEFLKFLAADPPAKRPTVSVLINCGFLEYRQNEVAVRMVRLFCRRNGYAFGSVLMIGSGEAILETPFRFLAARGIKRFARTVAERRYEELHVTMPLCKRLFLMASTLYWTQYGKRFGVTKQQMQTLRIEDGTNAVTSPSRLPTATARSRSSNSTCSRR